MATANLFTTAKTIESKATAGKKPAKSKILIEGLERYAAIDHTIKWLTTALSTIKVTVLEAATEKFITDGCARKGKPENFDGEEGNGTGNIQLRKRSTASGLSDIEQELCVTHKVPTETVLDRPDAVLWNPVHDAWMQKNAEKISAALAKLGAPADIFVKQEATTKVVTTDDSLDFVFRTFAKKPEVIATLLPVVGTLAIKPKYADNNNGALVIISELLGELAEDSLND